MIADVLQLVRGTPIPWLHYDITSIPGVINLTFLTLIVAWIIWRLWRFTITPLIWRDEVPMLPYLIPLLGHTLSFLRDMQGLFKYGNKYFKGDGPFILFGGGMRIVVIRCPADSKAVWNNTKEFSWDDMVKGVLEATGIPSTSYERMFAHNPAQFWTGGEIDAPLFVTQNPGKKSYLNSQEKMFKDQLLPGAKMEVLSKVLMGHVDESIEDYLKHDEHISLSSTGDSCYDLLDWCQLSLTEGATKAMFGSEFLEMNPNFVDLYRKWQSLAWKFVFRMPSNQCKDIKEIGEQMIQQIEKYYSLKSDERPNLSFWFQRMQSEQLKLGMTPHDVATFAILMLWGVNLNTYRMLFWTISHILSSPTLTLQIRKEIAPAFTESNSPSMNHLMKSCPTLTAIWLEVLRNYASSAVASTVITPTIIHNKKLHVGDEVYGPFRLTHFSHEIFGADADIFDHERWLRDPKLQNVKGFNPFGGGSHHCPGRVLAKQEVFLFVARVLWKYDVEFVPGSRIQSKSGAFGEFEERNGERRFTIPEPSFDIVMASLEPKDRVFVTVKERAIGK